MRSIVSRAMSCTSNVAVVEISPETTTRPVLTRVSQATRPRGSWARTASSTPSEIWSAILSGWPSVTDSEVKRNSLSSIARSVTTTTLVAFDEVDHQRNAFHAVALAHAVFEVVGVVTGDQRMRVDLDREA